MFKSFLRDRLIDLKRGLLTLPEGLDILFSVVVFLIYISVALCIGLYSGFMKIKVLTTDTWVMIFLPISLFFVPSLFEEMFFRGLLLPHKSRATSNRLLLLYSVFSIFIFIAWHPINAATINLPAFAVFTNLVFLCFAALMGIACTITYLKTGSIWVPAVIHWLTVLAWVFFFNGRNFVFDIAQ
ncbi:MAG: CPBP family glutamic-type intramembrane protease [Deltaproteobacteria bacterium]|nr:CPBP family glutamic-type intramembrane protease [Deltaproteobacteria bacterium]